MWKPVSVSLIAMLFSASAYAQTQNVEVASIPQNVMATVNQQVSGFAPQSANTEVEDGKTIYEIQGMAGDKQIEVDVMEDGTLDEVETIIDANQLPKEVQDAIMGKMPNFQVKKVEESRRAAGTYYEVEGSADGKDWDVEIKADGTDIKTSELKQQS
jgi:uncharacterized membrane protein YkoI